VAQLKPGVLQIIHEAGSSEPEKYFVAGGFALTHPDSTTVRKEKNSNSGEGESEKLLLAGSLVVALL
jgi:F0F1-type ATP synthase epsilon subunit